MSADTTAVHRRRVHLRGGERAPGHAPTYNRRVVNFDSVSLISAPGALPSFSTRTTQHASSMLSSSHFSSSSVSSGLSPIGCGTIITGGFPSTPQNPTACCTIRIRFSTLLTTRLLPNSTWQPAASPGSTQITMSSNGLSRNGYGYHLQRFPCTCKARKHLPAQSVYIHPMRTVGPVISSAACARKGWKRHHVERTF